MMAGKLEMGISALGGRFFLVPTFFHLDLDLLAEMITEMESLVGMAG
jgi:hypothetical protein